MPIPKYDELQIPILEFLSDGKERYTTLAQIFNHTDIKDKYKYSYKELTILYPDSIYYNGKKVKYNKPLYLDD